MIAKYHDSASFVKKVRERQAGVRGDVFEDAALFDLGYACGEHDCLFIDRKLGATHARDHASLYRLRIGTVSPSGVALKSVDVPISAKEVRRTLAISGGAKRRPLHTVVTPLLM